MRTDRHSKRRESPEDREPLELARGSLRAWASPRGGLRVSCDRGRLWATRAGDPKDHLIHAGETILFEGRGRIVIQALEDARARMDPLRAGGDARAVPWALRLLRAARDRLLRAGGKSSL